MVTGESSQVTSSHDKPLLMIYETQHRNCLDLNNRTSSVLRALVIVSQKCLRFGRFFTNTPSRETKMRCKVDKRIAVSKNLFV